MNNNKYFAVSFFGAALLSTIASVAASMICFIVYTCCILFLGEVEFAKEVAIFSFATSYCLAFLILYISTSKKGY